jgi:SAM-dependent methyltransferase
MDQGVTRNADNGIDFDAAYRGQEPSLGDGVRPPWSIGEPQPELASLIDKGAFHGEVLDAGCGEAALTLELAARGYDVVGIDLSPSAIELASAEAARRGLVSATFEVADITALAGYDGRFGTIVDSALFHALAPEQRDPYQDSIARAAGTGASYFVLAFDKAGLPSGPGHPVTLDELNAVVSRFWAIDSIRPARIHANLPGNFLDMFPGATLRKEAHGRTSVPGWLLSARKR